VIVAAAVAIILTIGIFLLAPELAVLLAISEGLAGTILVQY